LDGADDAGVDRMIADATDRAQQIGERQAQVRRTTAELQKEAANAPSTADARRTAATVERQRGLAQIQADNQRALEELQAYLGQAADRARDLGRTQAAKALHHAAGSLRDEDAAGAMVTSAVGLAQGDFDEAIAAQSSVTRQLDRLTEDLDEASGSGRSGEQKLRHVGREAHRLLAAATELAGHGVTPADPSAHRPSTQAPNDGKTAELRRATGRLARQLGRDQLGDAAVTARLQAIADDERAFAGMAAGHDEKLREAFVAALTITATSLEAKLESTLKAKRLTTAQREQAPAAYRALVNRYYEALAR
jgi:hypothetical protein